MYYAGSIESLKDDRDAYARIISRDVSMGRVPDSETVRAFRDVDVTIRALMRDVA